MDIDEVKAQFTVEGRSVLPPGISATVDKFEGLDTSSGYLSATMKVSRQLGGSAGKKLVVPAFLFTSVSAQFASEEKRESVIDLKYAEQLIDDVVYHLPAGFSVQSVPAAVQLPWTEHAALVVKTQASGSTVEIKHIFARAFVILDVKEYPALRDYYQKIAANDHLSLVLNGDNASAGN